MATIYIAYCERCDAGFASKLQKRVEELAVKHASADKLAIPGPHPVLFFEGDDDPRGVVVSTGVSR